MYCTFISLKAHNNLTLQFCAEELGLEGEEKLFQAYVVCLGHNHSLQYLTFSCRTIWDDGFYHALIVYEEHASRNLRLHAAVWDGELRQCPVWTVFGKYLKTTPF